ncbi:hypothetical protein LTR37_015044 [Vermiconidia calcicola]|uniref:Uncharacterized protein n=1 Tax=Vermiconidia calcicola TaxID=1690605 RepID=A0ACC3MRW2_9PEZI|nr:hypothetical protein LTR37_015044 [Vermiconidia calcicola]
MDFSPPSASLPGTTPSVGELSAEFAKEKRAKSPPLAFEKTSNDALAPRITSPSQGEIGSGAAVPSPSAIMGRLDTHLSEGLQIIIDQQANAINKLHDAFAAERQTWTLEKERLYQRIAKLERLLKSGDGYSPAKSPVLSPYNGGSNITSPQAKAMANQHRLPSIAEDENIVPLSQRRAQAPQSIDFTTLSPPSTKRGSSVGFAESTPTNVKVEEIPVSPGPTTKSLSPPPFNYRMEAGHTPLKPPGRPTAAPHSSIAVDGSDDTPTRNNTQLHAFLTQSDDEDEERELQGPLHMPELPNVPSDANFSFDMLSKRLEHIEKHPDQSKPMIFAQPSPGLASPAEPDEEASPKTVNNNTKNNAEGPPAPPGTHILPPQATNTSDVPTFALSPSGLPSLSKHASRDDKVQADFDSGGIRLKKKPSSNFGAPFGQLGGFGNPRKLS